MHLTRERCVFGCFRDEVLKLETMSLEGDFLRGAKASQPAILSEEMPFD